MPTPNYQFEKRKRDLEKKAKKDEKKRRKLEEKTSPSANAEEGTSDAETPAPASE